jgi:hypothetical protein
MQIIQLTHSLQGSYVYAIYVEVTKISDNRMLHICSFNNHTVADDTANILMYNNSRSDSSIKRLVLKTFYLITQLYR